MEMVMWEKIYGLEQRIIAVESTCSSRMLDNVDREASSAFKPVCEKLAHDLAEQLWNAKYIYECLGPMELIDQFLQTTLPELLDKARSTPD